MAQQEPSGEGKAGAWKPHGTAFLWEAVKKGVTEATSTTPEPNTETWIEKPVSGEATATIVHEPLLMPEGYTANIVAHVFGIAAAAETVANIQATWRTKTGGVNSTVGVKLKAASNKWVSTAELTGVEWWAAKEGSWGINLIPQGTAAAKVYACYLTATPVVGNVVTKPIILAAQSVKRGSLI